MHGSNTPTEFILTPENLLETLAEWMPNQLNKMRQYTGGAIRIVESSNILECNYVSIFDGEMFRIDDIVPFGSGSSWYYEPLCQDDDIIVDFARRIETKFQSIKRQNERLYIDNPKPVELIMVFKPGRLTPFISRRAELVFYLTQLDGRERNEKLGISKEHYSNKKLALQWYCDIANYVHSDRGGDDRAFQELGRIYKNLTDVDADV